MTNHEFEFEFEFSIDYNTNSEKLLQIKILHFLLFHVMANLWLTF